MKYKLLARMLYYHDNLHRISPNSSILAILRNRIETLKLLKDYTELDGLSLINATERKLQLNPSIFYQKSIIERSNIIGKVYSLSKNKLLFLGFPEEVFNLLINQSFSKIVNYKQLDTMTVVETITCRIPKRGFLYYQLKQSPLNEWDKSNKSIFQFDIRALVHYTPSGKVFSIINLDREQVIR